MKWGEKYIISSHPCIAIGGFRTIFLELNEYAWESSHATFEDVSKIFVKGKGEILVFLKNRGHEFIPNIYHKFITQTWKTYNILSLDQLWEKSDEIHRKNRSLPIGYHYVNFISNVSMTRKRIFLLNNQNYVVLKIPNICCQWSLLDLPLKILTS